MPAPNNRKVANFANAGRNFELPEGPLRDKYPLGIDYDREGFPIFDPWVIAEVDIRMRGSAADFDAAERAFNPEWKRGMPRIGEDYLVWHHLQDGRTMQLIPRDLNENIRHTGGDAIVRHIRKYFRSGR